uniref:RRM domain-containing protein n=1 Tax=Pyramimonas obovata TaxID=1411642 RepID=A0A7S0WMG2_9CHLO|mmetsp:Transcript_30898/g.67497  ORF Transcript_30898/g.67497 Transcript_30898/m.67497 type:complete len:168 (+) Transcript_30898:121-624(+)
MAGGSSEVPPAKRQRSEAPADDPETAVFVGGLPYETDEASLKTVFSTYGEVKSTKIIYDNQTKKSKGFGFVTFASSEVATSVKSMKKMEIAGRQVDLGEPASNKGKQANKDRSVQVKQEQSRGMQKQMAKSAPPERRVFVGNLPKELWLRHLSGPELRSYGEELRAC